MSIYSISGAARFIGISPEAVRKAANRGWVPSYWEATHHGRERRFTESDLVVYRARRIARINEAHAVSPAVTAA